MPCTLDCLQTYGCGDPIEVSPGAIYTPYMVVEFDAGKITVGNQSSPGNNMAALSSLTYGCTAGTDGFGCDVEIIDQGGTMYRQIIQALNKSIVKVKEETFATSVDFGWVITDCTGTSRLETVLTLTGKKIYCHFLSLEQNYENAIIKLKVKLRGPGVRIPEVRHDGSIGDEDNKIELKDALRRLFTENEPKFANVEFRGKDGGEFNFKNSDGGPDGPRASWPMGQQNPLATARTWLQSITTENDRGILISYDPSTVSIVFMEDPTEKKCCTGSYGTYVVNGGNCSPVLSFNPTISWPKGMIPGGGGTPGGSASGGNDEYVEPTLNIERAGTQTSPTVQQHEWQWRNPDDLAAGASLGIAAHMEANAPGDSGRAAGGMKAELKIHGNPEYVDPVKLKTQWLSLIVINPFHITGKTGDCTWVTTSNCNATLSNKKWKINGVSHQITGGSFVTTFDLMLDLPNKDIDATDALGGNGCGTELFENSVTGDAD